MSWRPAHSITQLQKELDVVFSRRTKPDWTIGDAAHRNRSSDHNPLKPPGPPIVCAIDIRGRDTAQAVWDWMLAHRPNRLKYMIFRAQIVSSTRTPWQVRSRNRKPDEDHPYHIHVSVGRGDNGHSTHPELYDDPSPWGLARTAPLPPSPPSDDDWRRKVMSKPVLRKGARSHDVRILQTLLVAHGNRPGDWYGNPSIGPDGIFGLGVETTLRAWQGRTGVLPSNGVCDADDWEWLVGV